MHTRMYDNVRMECKEELLNHFLQHFDEDTACIDSMTDRTEELVLKPREGFCSTSVLKSGILSSVFRSALKSVMISHFDEIALIH